MLAVPADDIGAHGYDLSCETGWGAAKVIA